MGYWSYGTLAPPTTFWATSDEVAHQPHHRLNCTLLHIYPYQNKLFPIWLHSDSTYALKYGR